MTKHRQVYRSGLFPGLLLSVVCLFLLPSCHNDPDDIRALMGGGGRQTDKADTVTVIYSKDGHIKVKLYGREFFRNESAKPAYIDMNRDIKAIFYDDSGHQDQVLTADSARYYTGQGNALVWDSVHVATRKGEQLNTDELVWNESVQQFFTEKPVKITTPTEVLYGKGLESNSDFSNYKILSPTGTVQVNKGEVPQ
jgi:LPS export ABC transporter protein LptC